MLTYSTKDYSFRTKKSAGLRIVIHVSKCLKILICYAVLCSSMQFYAVLCNSMQFYAVLCNALVISITLSEEKITDYCKPHSWNYIQKYILDTSASQWVFNEHCSKESFQKKVYLNILYPKNTISTIISFINQLLMCDSRWWWLHCLHTWI